MNKVLKRLISLEEALGLIYSPGDGKEGYDQHVNDSYGRFVELDKIIEERRTKKKNK